MHRPNCYSQAYSRYHSSEMYNCFQRNRDATLLTSSAACPRAHNPCDDCAEDAAVHHHVLQRARQMCFFDEEVLYNHQILCLDDIVATRNEVQL